MVGGGVFSLPHDLAVGANSGSIIIGWCITAMGMIPLALVYQTLARKKPELEGGIYSYARAGFGEYIDLTVLGILVSRNFRKRCNNHVTV